MHMQYFEDKPCEKSCMILMKGARESIEWMKKGKYKRAELVLECALEMWVTFWKEEI